MWNFILTDLNFVPVGEIRNAANRKIALPLNNLDTLSFQVRLDNPLADALASTAGYIKAYRDKQLLYYGPIVSAEENADSSAATVAVNSVGAGWVLGERLAGKSATGYIFGAGIDRATIVNQLITMANTESETHIDTSYGVSSPSSINYTAGPYRPISEIITELSASTQGFDWRIVPMENYVSGTVTSQKIGQFQATNIWGTEQDNAVFEFGAGRANVASYQRTVSRDTQANKVYNFTSNGPDAPGYPTVSAIDASSVSQWGLLEALADADLLDPSLRSQLVSDHVSVRKQPRQVINFVPHIDPQRTGRLPYYGNDYSVGDIVRARAVVNGSVRFDDMFRVYGVTFDIDANGVERITLQLVDQ